MIIKHTISLPTIIATNDVVNKLRECGIPVTVEDKNAIQKTLHIELPNDASMDDVLALGALIGSVETRVLFS